MKLLRFFTFFALISLAGLLYAQTPQGFNYQAVVRDNSGKVLANKNITVKLVILSGQSASKKVYEETHSVTTTDLGHFNVVVGSGSTSDDFSAISWSAEPHHVKVEIDQGSGYVVMGTVQLQSVPYAMHSATADKANSATMSANDLTDVTTTGATKDQVLKWNGSEWAPAADASGAASFTAGSGIDITGNTISANSSNPMWNADKLNGKSVDTKTPANGEVLKWDGTKWTPASDAINNYSAGNGIDINSGTINANSSNAMWNASDLQGRPVDSKLPSSNQVLKWDGTKWTPGTDASNAYTGGTGIDITGTTVTAKNTDALWNASDLQGRAVDSKLPSTKQVLKWDGTQWTPGTDSVNNYTAGTGIDIASGAIAAKNGDALWNANKLNGISLSTSTPSKNQVIQYDGSNWGFATLSGGGSGSSVWDTTGNDIYFMGGNVGINNDNPNTRLAVKDSITHSSNGFYIMTDNYMYGGSGTGARYVANRSVLYGQGGLSNMGAMNVAAGDIYGSGGEAIATYSQADGDGSYNIASFNTVGADATSQSIGVFSSARASSTFNIGVFTYADKSNSNGNYGIYAIGDSASTSYAGYFDGDVNYTGTLTNTSDIRFKRDVENLESATSLVSKLRPTTYYFKNEGDAAYLNLAKGKQYGFIAQEIEQVLPELVHNQKHIKEFKSDESIDYKAVNYIGLIPILTKAIQEQQQTIESLEQRIQELEASKK